MTHASVAASSAPSRERLRTHDRPEIRAGGAAGGSTTIPSRRFSSTACARSKSVTRPRPLQAIYLWEHRRTPHTRNLVVHVQGV